MPDEHARLSASGSEIWTNCPSSPIMSDQYENQDNEYSVEGTLAHALMETVLRSGRQCDYYMYHCQIDFDITQQQLDNKEKK